MLRASALGPEGFGMAYVPINRTRALIIAGALKTMPPRVYGKQRGICLIGGTRQRKRSVWRPRRSSCYEASGMENPRRKQSRFRNRSRRQLNRVAAHRPSRPHAPAADRSAVSPRWRCTHAALGRPRNGTLRAFLNQPRLQLSCSVMRSG